MKTPESILEQLYSQSVEFSYSTLNTTQRDWVSIIIQNAEQQKAVLAALLTSLVKKLVTPEQDIRLHKAEFEGGYSGRVFDTQHITPFIHQKFPRLAMRSGSGWLTRSIEQASPFDLQFPGRISNRQVKSAFLNILNDVQVAGAPAENYIIEIFIELRQLASIKVTQPNRHTSEVITVKQVLDALQTHFSFPYRVAGAARLPVIALYSIYQLLMETPRYQDKKLVPLKSHTTSDMKSRTIGDIEIVRADGTYFEAVEVKHHIPITVTMVDGAFDKIRTLPVTRYYLLTTAEPNTVEAELISERAEAILFDHGCEIIVNGIMPSLKYYLRLLPEPFAFLERYSENLLADYNASTDIKRIHIEQWNSLNPASSKG